MSDGNGGAIPFDRAAVVLGGKTSIPNSENIVKNLLGGADATFGIALAAAGILYQLEQIALELGVGPPVEAAEAADAEPKQ